MHALLLGLSLSMYAGVAGLQGIDTFDDFFLSYGIHKYVIIIAITYVLNNN
jgi:hypothetical protein